MIGFFFYVSGMGVIFVPYYLLCIFLENIEFAIIIYYVVITGVVFGLWRLHSHYRVALVIGCMHALLSILAIEFFSSRINLIYLALYYLFLALLVSIISIAVSFVNYKKQLFSSKMFGLIVLISIFHFIFSFVIVKTIDIIYPLYR